MSFTIRPAVVDDAAAIAAVHVTTWQEAYRGVVSGAALAALDVGVRTGEWRARLTTAGPGQPSALVVVDEGGAVRAFASYGKSRDADMADHGELYAIYVSTSFQGSGAGTALLDAVERALASCALAALWVLAANVKARRFYEAHGWAVDGASRVVTGSAATGLVEVRYRKSLTSSRGRAEISSS